MRTVMVRYKTSEAQAETNASLVRAVFEQLSVRKPDGLRYATYRLPDGVTFVHVATIAAAENPLLSLPAFQEFQRGINERCVEPPMVTQLGVIGAYESEAR